MPTIGFPVPDLHTLNEPEVASEETSTLRFDHFGSDTIALRSCDSYNFHVSKSYIINSSPVFRELILRSVSTTLADVPGGEVQESLPEVKLPESGETLHGLLTFIFPIVPILPSSIEKVMELIAVAQKYQMHSVLSHIYGITGIGRKDPTFIRPETAFQVYILARKHELHHEALQAAQFTLHLPMVLEDLGDRLDSSDVTGIHLNELWEYHERVRTDLKSALLEFRKFGLPEDAKRLCNRDLSESRDSCPRWLENYMKSIADTPHRFDYSSFKDAHAYHLQNSARDIAVFHHMCSCANSPVIHTCWDALTTIVHDTIEIVPLVRRIGVTVPLR